MGKGSSSSNQTVSKAVNFNNIDYGDGTAGGGAGGFAKNINLSDSRLNIRDVTSTDHGAVSGALDFAGSVNTANAELILAMGDRAFDDVADSRDFAGDIFSGALSSVNSNSRDSLQFLGQSTERALAFAQQSTRSEAGQTVETLTKYFVIGGGVLAVLIIMKGRK